MNGKKWTEGVVRSCIKKGFTKNDFIKEFQMKDINELKDMLGRIYKFEDVSINKRISEMEQNEKHKANRKNKSKKQNNNAGAAFVPVASSGMTVPYNVSNQQMISAQQLAVNVPTKLPVLDEAATKTVNKLELNSGTSGDVVKLQELSVKLADNESYVSELEGKLAAEKAKYLENIKWFSELSARIKNLINELQEAKKNAKEKANSMESSLERIAETEAFIKMANADSEDFRKQISALQAKKVYFGNCKEVQMDFDYLAENVPIQDDAVIMKITNFFTEEDVSALISNFSGKQIRRLAEISYITDTLKKEETELELYFDESNDFTEMVALITSCKVAVTK